ncbi:MAG: alpha/beta hydrolase [bacterium]|nr:alpha/beta hydrolase [bacterium]
MLGGVTQTPTPYVDELLDTAMDLVVRPAECMSEHSGAPTVVYLPGVHGDWTPLGWLRPHLARATRLVETAYPRQAEWTLVDHAASLARLIGRLDGRPVHVLAESFGSLVGWQFALDYPGCAASLILAGGFTRPPHPFQVGAARAGLRLVPRRVFEKGMDLYLARVAHYAGAPVPGLDGATPPFAAVRGRRGRRALMNRLRLIQHADFRGRLNEIGMPVAYLGGAADRIVPVREEVAVLERVLAPVCRFRSRIIPGAPHPILPACAREAARFVMEWINSVAKDAAAGSAAGERTSSR